ncbi:MAG: hypothetical protein ACRDT4_12775 [Micromonosporaceae bacterium]
MSRLRTTWSWALVTALVIPLAAIAATPSPAAAAGDGIDTIGVVRDGQWYLSNSFGGAADHVFGYGNPGDAVVVGDWNGDGIDTPGVFRGGSWYLSNGYDGSVAHAFSYGVSGDVPVAGDWNGDGIDTVGVFRGDTWYLSDSHGGGANYVFAYGVSGDRPVTGDWNGDGRDTIGVMRGDAWYLSDSFGGVGDYIFSYGIAGDLPVTGDWNNDGRDTIGVVRNASWFLSDSFGGTGDHNFVYGTAGDIPVAGDWDGGTPPPPPPPPPPSNCPYNARVITYNPNGWTTLLDAFAANPTPCADYYITLPAIVTNDSNSKLYPRGGAAVTNVRAKGGNFHPVAEFHYNKWAAVSGMTWYQKGVEFRRRMNAAGYDQTRQETWAINELPSTVRTDPAVRQNVRDLVRGLYQGPDGVGLGGAVFVINFGHTTTYLPVYKGNMKDWTLDSAFWSTMNSYVRWWGQETYTSCSVTCVPGASIGEKSQYVNDFIEHPARLAFAGPTGAGAARSFFNESYMPLMTAYWKSSTYGGTNLPLDTMKKLVSLQTYAARAWAGSHVYPDGRIAFAWNEAVSDPAGAQELATRLAAAIAGAYGDGGTASRACSPSGAFTWCNPELSGANFNPAWQTFATW